MRLHAAVALALALLLAGSGCFDEPPPESPGPPSSPVGPAPEPTPEPAPEVAVADPTSELAPETSSGTHDFRIRFVGIEPISGSVNVALFASEEDMAARNLYEGKIEPVTGEELTIVFAIPPGAWAFSSFHDVNGNGELDTNLVGIPTEPWAFSNNARGAVGPPSYEQMEFQMGAALLEMEIEFQ